jgi:hypothetical protein
LPVSAEVEPGNDDTGVEYRFKHLLFFTVLPDQTIYVFGLEVKLARFLSVVRVQPRQFFFNNISPHSLPEQLATGATLNLFSHRVK